MAGRASRNRQVTLGPGTAPKDRASGRRDDPLMPIPKRHRRRRQRSNTLNRWVSPAEYQVVKRRSENRVDDLLAKTPEQRRVAEATGLLLQQGCITRNEASDFAEQFALKEKEVVDLWVRWVKDRRAVWIRGEPDTLWARRATSPGVEEAVRRELTEQGDLRGRHPLALARRRGGDPDDESPATRSPWVCGARRSRQAENAVGGSNRLGPWNQAGASVQE